MTKNRYHILEDVWQNLENTAIEPHDGFTQDKDIDEIAEYFIEQCLAQGAKKR